MNNINLWTYLFGLAITCIGTATVFFNAIIMIYGAQIIDIIDIMARFGVISGIGFFLAGVCIMMQVIRNHSR